MLPCIETWKYCLIDAQLNRRIHVEIGREIRHIMQEAQDAQTILMPIVTKKEEKHTQTAG